MKRILLVLCLICVFCLLISCADNAQSKKEDNESAAPKVETAPDGAATLISVDIENLPQRVNYYSGDTLSAEGLTLTLTYDDGTTKTVSEGFDCSPTSFHDTKENGTEEIAVQVSYHGLPAGEFTVNVVDGVELMSSDYMEERTDNKTELLSKDSYYVVCGAEEYKDAEIVLPSVYGGVAVKTVKDFRNDNVKKIVLDDGFEALPIRAFWYCSLLEEIVLPASLSRIEANAAFACPNLKKLTVDADSTHFVSDDRGIVYNKDMTVLVMGPKWMTGSSTLVIPEGVTEIAPGAFAYSSYIGTLILPKTLTEIGEYAFSENKALYVVVIPENVTTIGSNAFDFPQNVYPDEIHCQAAKKPDGWATDWINSKASMCVNWKSRYVDWDTLTVK